MTYSLLIFLTFVLLYIYLGYSLILWVVSAMFPRGHVIDERFEPSITQIISARNEEKSIGAKLENSLQLDYPSDKLTIMVVSDCSDDRTDEIVRSFSSRRVVLVRTSERKGKTAGLNEAFATITSDMIVFSDANAMYDRFALRRLVRHFADKEVGYVVGDARYEDISESSAGSCEGAYWNLETKMKEWESAFSSVVGGDGAIYAIRRHLYEPLQETDINDFVNPLQIVAKGYRGVYDPEAWCSEKPAGEFHKEFSRKVRIANRSFNGLLRVGWVCNPFRFGRFSWQLVSHKLLRWLSPFIVFLHLSLSLIAGGKPSGGYLPLLFTCSYGMISLLALIGWWGEHRKRGRAIFSLPYYLVLMNVASAMGILLRLKGEIITTWETVREKFSLRNRVVSLMPVLLSLIALGCTARVFQRFGLGLVIMEILAVALFLVLCYTYIGYPVVVAALARMRPVRTTQDEHLLPEVTLLISAHNEEQCIESKLINSLSLNYPSSHLQIVVVSDGSTDATNQIVRKFMDHDVKLISFPVNRGKIASLNEAMKQIHTEIVVFSDANVMYEPQAIRRLVRHFSDPRVGAVSGKVILQNDSVSYSIAENQYYNIEHFVQNQEGLTGTVIGADGAMYAIRRSLFSPPPSDTILDDFSIAMHIARKDYLVLHEKEALGFEDNLSEIGKEFRRKVRIIAGGIQCLLDGRALPRGDQKMLWFKFLSHKVLRWFSGLLTLLLIGVLLEICSVDGSPFFRGMLNALLAAVLIAAIGQIVPITRKILPVSLLHYLLMLKIAAIVGCYFGFTGRQQVTWRSLRAE